MAAKNNKKPTTPDPTNIGKDADRDLAERNRDQKVLDQKHRLNELLLDSLPHIAMLIRKDRRVLAANRLARDVGAKVGDYCWQSFGRGEFIPEEDKKYIQEYKKAPPGGACCYFCLADKAFQSQKPTRNPEIELWGKIWDVHWVPLDEQTYLHYAIDITEYKQTERDLLFKTTILEAQTETSIDGILVVDRQGKSILVNKRFGEMWNIPQQMLDTKDDKAMVQYVLGQITEPDKFVGKIEYLYTHENEQSRDEIKFKDGKVFDRYSSPLKDSRGARKGRIWYFRDITMRKRAEADLMEYRGQLENLVGARTAELTQANERLLLEIQRRKHLETGILNISDREQRRVGRELHDSVGQQLTGIAFLTKALEQKLAAKSPAEAADLAQISKLVQATMEQTRDLAKGLHPVDLDAGGLVSSLSELAQATQKLFGIRCTFKCDRPIEMETAQMAAHLYRITQEAITNAIRHGKAKNIQVVLAYGKDESTLTIENDGLDFPKAAKTKGKGMGLQIMGHRADIIGGSLHIHKVDSGGAIVTCRFPNP